MSNEAELERLHSVFEAISGQMSKAVVSQDAVIEQMVIALLAQGHCMVEGPAGAAKSRAAASLARVLGLRFDRVRCTAELTPQEVVGKGAAPKLDSEVPGPIFANVVLVDDVTRLSPATDSLLQQAIQDDQIVLDGRRHWLPNPYMILATCYPDHEDLEATVEHHDDRYMMKIGIGYPDYEDEFALAEKLATPLEEPLDQVVAPEDFPKFRQVIAGIEMPPHTIHYALRLVRATRVHEGETPDFIFEWVDFGAGPRAAHFITLAAKTRAALHGRGAVTSEDVREVTHPVLRHRIVTNRNARSTGVTVDRVIRRLLYEIADREDGDDVSPSHAD